VDLEYKCGLTGQSIRDNGILERLTVGVNLPMLMGISTKVNGKTTKPVATVSTNTTTGPNIKVNG